MEWAVCTASCDSEDEVDEEACAEVAAESYTSPSQVPIDLAFVSKAASAKNDLASRDSMEAEAGKKSPHKDVQDLTQFGEKDGHEVPVHYGRRPTLTVNASEKDGVSYSAFQDQTMATMSDEEEKLVTQEDLGESTEEHHNYAAEFLVTKMGNTKKVCIVGDSWIVGLRRYCQHLGIDSNFGCPGVELSWHGQDDMKWESVIQNIMEKSEARGADVLIIHCGGNNLGIMRGVSLMCQMKDDLSRILQMLPNCKLVFSTIAERRVWKLGAVSGRKLERTRRRVNKEVAAFLRDHQMDSIKHRNINFADATLYCNDGVCLSRKGNDRFLRNIKEYLNL